MKSLYLELTEDVKQKQNKKKKKSQQHTLIDTPLQSLVQLNRPLIIVLLFPIMLTKMMPSILITHLLQSLLIICHQV